MCFVVVVFVVQMKLTLCRLSQVATEHLSQVRSCAVGMNAAQLHVLHEVNNVHGVVCPIADEYS
jgi:hypothetical protein